MRFLKWIASFFGFGEDEELSKKEKLLLLLEEIGSQEKLNECRRMAFDIIQKKDAIQPGKPHPYEATIRGDCVSVDTALTEYHNEELNKSFSEARYLMTLIENGINVELNNSSAANLKQKITGQIALSSPDVEKIKTDLVIARNDLTIFKGANNLGAEANHPESVSNSLYFIAGVALLEALFNIAFLREQLDGHIALIVAIGIAGINVGVNVWFGIKYRDKNHVKKEISDNGKRFKVYAFLAIVFLNSLIAYFRYDSYNKEDEITAQFILESSVLFFVGIILGIASFNKGYALDDPYPDYGRLSRKVEKLENSIKEISVQHAQFCEKIKSAATLAHDSLKQRIYSSSNSLSATLPEMSQKLHEWSAQRNQLNYVYTQHQDIFKNAIIANHPNADEYPKNVDSLPINSQLDSHQKEVENFIGQKEKIQNAVAVLVKEVDDSYESLHAWLISDDAKECWRWPN